MDIIYFDFSKAFDTVPHNRLFNKLRGYGVDGKLLEWFRSFLTDRHQCVQINESISSWAREKAESHKDLFLVPSLLFSNIDD